jgi:hypothetical protein
MSSSMPTRSSSAPLRSGQMPCDGVWPTAQVEKLQQWVDLGKPT